MIERWMKEYVKEMKDENIQACDIASDKIDEENLFDKCKVVYNNFSKLIHPE